MEFAKVYPTLYPYLMRAVVSCPICRKPVIWADNPHRPFCSERCKLVDLGAWVSEVYRVPGEGIEIAEDGAGTVESTPDFDERPAPRRTH